MLNRMGASIKPWGTAQWSNYGCHLSLSSLGLPSHKVEPSQIDLLIPCPTDHLKDAILGLYFLKVPIRVTRETLVLLMVHTIYFFNCCPILYNLHK